MDISLWAIAAVITRWLTYGGLAILVAIPTMVAVSPHNLELYLQRHAVVAALLAGFASISYFFIQVGSLSESGWLGMADSLMVSIVWLSGYGTSLLYQWIAIVLLTGLCVFRIHHQYHWLGVTVFLLAATSLALSFISTGHTASLSGWVKAALSVHVLVALWWIGSLLPLAQACDKIRSDHLYQLMHRFGKIAIVLVVMLCVMGIVLAYQLVASFNQLFTTSYGQALLLKLVAVSSILLLAAWHKWYQVPMLRYKEKAHLRLARSIKLEWLIGMLIMLITIILSSIVEQK